MRVLGKTQVGDTLVCERAKVRVASVDEEHVTLEDGRRLRRDNGRLRLPNGRTDRWTSAIPLAQHIREEKVHQLTNDLLALAERTCIELEVYEAFAEYRYLDDAGLDRALSLTAELKVMLKVPVEESAKETRR